MEKFLTLSEKLDFFDKISNQNDEKELEKLFQYIERLENTIKNYELNINNFIGFFEKSK